MTPRTLTYARTMRRAPTPAEQRLWLALKNGRLDGRKWRRQVPFANMIVDFYCPSSRLVIEVDGATHAEPARDAARDADLRALGLDVLHVWNNDVMGNVEGVLVLILQTIRGTTPSPHPLPQGEGED